MGTLEIRENSGGRRHYLDDQYLVHVGKDGTVLLPYSQTKQTLDHLKRLCVGRDLPDAAAARKKQLPRQVELNLQLKRLGDAHAAVRVRM